MSRAARAALALALGALIAAAPGAAQVEGALDVGYGHDHVWRGLTRASRPTVQPALTLAWKRPNLMLSAGGWALLEPWDPEPDDLSLAGADGGPGELDVWTQLDYRLTLASATLDLRAGWIGYTYHGDPSTGGLGDEYDTSELYVGARLEGLGQLYAIVGLPPDLPIGFEASAAIDLGPVGGVYGETGLVAELPVLFLGEPLQSVVAGLTAGWTGGQHATGDPSAAAPESVRYAGDGLTHVLLSLQATPLFRPAGIPFTLHLDGNLQLGVDRATRRRGPDPDDTARVIGWLDVTASVLFPLRRMP